MSDDITYPVALPFYPIDGTLSGQIQDKDLVFTPDVGPDQIRSRYSANFKSVSFDVLMTRAQFITLEDFFLNTCAKRVNPFVARNVYNPAAGSIKYSWTAAPTDRASLPNNSKLRVSFNLLMWL